MRTLDPAIRAHLRPARRPLRVVVGAGVLQAVLVVAQAFIVAGAVVAMVDHTSLVRWLTALLVVTALRAAASYAADDAASRAAALVVTALRRRLLSQLAQGPGDGVPRSTGSQVVLATRGVQETEPYLTRYLPALVLAALVPPVAVLAIATQDLLSAVIVLLTLPLVPLFAALVGWRTRERAERQWRQMSLLGGHFLDVVKGLPTLVSFRRAEHQIATIRSITHRYRVATMSTLRLAFASSAVLELVATLSVALVAVSVGLRLASGSMDLRTALTVLLLAPEAYWPVRRVGAEFHAAAPGAAAFGQVDAILSGSHRDEPQPFAVVPTAGPVLELMLEGVSVTYPGETGGPALAQTSARWRRPGLVAVTGPSGAGKSTLLAAIQGRIPVSSGAIGVNGLALDDLDRSWWASQVSWSPQRPFFVPGSVAANLRLARPEANDGQLWSALRMVGLASVVSALPGGLHAAVDEDGLSLSAGERARLALARVVVAKRPVVLLDEPTAHLDAESESIVVSTIKALAADALVVVVAHRPAIASAADQVLHLAGREPEAHSAGGEQPVIAGERRRRSSAATPSGRSRATRGAEPAPPSIRRTRLLLAASVALGALAAASGIALTATAGWLVVKASTHPPVLLLLVAIIGVRTFGIARPVLRYVERLISHDAAMRLLAEKRASVYAALVPLTPARLGRRRGDVLTSVVEDAEAWVDRRLRVWLPVATLVLTSLIALAVVAALLPQAALLDLVLVALGGGGVFWAVRWSVSRSDAARVKGRADLGDRITALLEGAAELRAWGAAERTLARVDTESRHVEALRATSSRRSARGRAAVVLAVGLAVAASFVVTAAAVTAGTLSAPMGALVVLVPLAMSELLQPVTDAAVGDVRSRHALARLQRLLDQSPAVDDVSPSVPIEDGIRDLDVDGVTAGWGPQPALTSLDLRLPVGARVGVVGPSGSGKSTLAALLVRFLDPAQGSIRYAGADLRTCSLDEVRRTVGLLDDDPHVFATTVAENIRLADPDASDDDVAAALRTASLGSWLENLPEGLDTWIGEGNRAVSGGERARLGMARVILAEQPVVVLDEPTAHLDHQMAHQVVASLFRGAVHRSVVLITHRPEGLDLVDHVVSLDSRPRELTPT